MLEWDEDFKKLICFLKYQKEKPFLICDENTYKVCGDYISKELEKQKREYDLLILPGNSSSDEKSICKVLLNTEENSLIVSIGSGSITDTARFVAYKQKLRFVSVPTAPSMDGYASPVSALTIDGLKTTVLAKPPEKIFVNFNIIKNSPDILKKAGFGDLMGKYTALSDWMLSNILTGENINLNVVNEMYDACENTLKSIEKEDFEKLLLEGLVKSGKLMIVVGNSRPASGSEHHLAHYLEFLGYNLFHGIKVGISTLYIIRLYKNLLKIDLDDFRNNIAYSIEDWKKEIKNNFPNIYDKIIKENIERLKKMNDPSFRREMIKKIKENIKKIYSIVETLDKKEKEILEGYKKINFSITLEDWGIKKEDLRRAIIYSLYIRDRFSILTLYQMLGILKEEAEKIIS
ncbi:MAG: iron-containing alcohol dehydrogenase [Dictyoglomus sp.]|nr:iron-containing alcohol dehydrogenase [Dictyoglomus sp.]MDW8189004.1 iron-containing alcohol dehydrogenase [Dictyoglomus sp.]